MTRGNVDRDKANQYAAYMAGWTAGAKVSAMDPAFTGHINDGLRSAYEVGYRHGRDARNTASHDASRAYGHTPSILRLAGEP